MPRSWHYMLLWFVALLSLFFNVLLMTGLNNLQDQAHTELSRAAAELEAVELEAFVLPVIIDETLPISLTVPFDDTFIVPINTTIPIVTEIPFKETVVVPIKTVIPIDTSVEVSLPLFGPINLPIVTSIPVDLAVEVVIDRTIPVDVDIPVRLTVEVPIESEVPIRADIPVHLDVPVSIPLDEMGLGALLDSLQQALAGLAASLGG